MKGIYQEFWGRLLTACHLIRATMSQRVQEEKVTPPRICTVMAMSLMQEELTRRSRGKLGDDPKSAEENTQ